MKRVYSFSKEPRRSKRIREQKNVESWMQPVAEHISDILAIPDIWTHIFQYIDTQQAWTMLFVSKSMNEWVRHYVQRFDTTVLYRDHDIPLCQNMFPNLRVLKMKMHHDPLHRFWRTIPQTLVHLQELDIDFIDDVYCPSEFLDWVRLHPDEFALSKDHDQPLKAIATPRPIKKLTIRNKTGSNVACELRYALLQVEEFRAIDCNVLTSLFRSVAQGPNIKNIIIEMNIWPTWIWITNIIKIFKDYPKISFELHMEIMDASHFQIWDFIHKCREIKNVNIHQKNL